MNNELKKIIILVIIIVTLVILWYYNNKKGKNRINRFYDNTKIYIENKGNEDEKKIIYQDGKEIIEIDKNNKKDSFGGIKIGDPIEKVINKNGKDFYFYGFEWEYGGMVYNWNGGNFKNGQISIWFDLIGKYRFDEVENLIGDDKKIYTKNLDLNKYKIVVSKIQYLK